MSRRPDHTPKRKAFPKSVRMAVLERSGGSCEAYGCDKPGREFDHIKPVYMGGQSTLENCQLLCAECHAERTAQQSADCAKADRQGGRSGQYARRKKRGSSSIPTHNNPWPPKGSRRIQSRGF